MGLRPTHSPRVRERECSRFFSRRAFSLSRSSWRLAPAEDEEFRQFRVRERHGFPLLELGTNAAVFEDFVPYDFLDEICPLSTGRFFGAGAGFATQNGDFDLRRSSSRPMILSISSTGATFPCERADLVGLDVGDGGQVGALRPRGHGRVDADGVEGLRNRSSTTGSSSATRLSGSSWGWSR